MLECEDLFPVWFHRVWNWIRWKLFGIWLCVCHVFHSCLWWFHRRQESSLHNQRFRRDKKERRGVGTGVLLFRLFVERERDKRWCYGNWRRNRLIRVRVQLALILWFVSGCSICHCLFISFMSVFSFFVVQINTLMVVGLPLAFDSPLLVFSFFRFPAHTNIDSDTSKVFLIF